jgi:hypothetical protein
MAGTTVLSGGKAMAFNVRRVEYFYARIADRPGEGFQVLRQLAETGVNLLAFTAVPIGPVYTQLTLLPDDAQRMAAAARRANLTLDGPHRALLVRGDDELGALASVHERLADAGINVYASSGVTDGQGSYGYVLYVRPDKFEQAAGALGI